MRWWEEDIDDDGLAPSYQGVETVYAQIEDLSIKGCERGSFLSVILDYQDIFIEARIPLEVLEMNGFTFKPVD